MDVLSPLAEGVLVALSPLNIVLAFVGALTGTLVGMLPGIGPINAIAILIPVLLGADLPKASTLILLSAIYYGSQYGNSISSILLNVPGTASSTVTALDGYAMTVRGRAADALATSAVASFVGGTISVVAMMLFAPALSRWAIRFGPAEYFALMVLALATLSSLAGQSTAKAIASTLFGLILATVGFDPHSAVPRFTFGELRLLDGLDFVVVTIGLFAVSEVFAALSAPPKAGPPASAERFRAIAKARDSLRSLWTMLRGSVVGFLVGVLPGAGGTIASFMAYTVEKRWLGDAQSFGEGDPRGVAAPEAANNAASTGAMIPLLTLGVPGSGTTAVLLGALLGLNITPGPRFIVENADVFWGLVVSMYLGNIMLLVLNLPLVGVFARVLSVPRWFVVPAIAGLSFVAVYSVNQSEFDLILMTIFGAVGYAMRRRGFPLAPVVLGLVLGGIMERSLRRATALSGGGWEVLFSSPLAVGLWLLAIASVVLPRLGWRRAARV